MCLQVNAEGAFKYASSPWFAQSLHLLANSGAYGVAVDVWVRSSSTVQGPGHILGRPRNAVLTRLPFCAPRWTWALQWGAVEREPGQYTWTGYKQLLEVIRPTGLKLQVRLLRAQHGPGATWPTAACMQHAPHRSFTCGTLHYTLRRLC